MKNSKAGFTLVETLAVIAILTILMAIIFPVYSRSILQTKAKMAPHNLRQIWMSMKLYQEEMGGETGTYDSWSGENLPPLADGVAIIRKFASDDKQSTCGRHAGTSDGDPSIEYQNNRDRSDRVIKQFKEKTNAFVDPNCNNGSVNIKSQFQLKRAIAINIEGQIFDVTSDRWQYWQSYFWGLE